MARYFLEVMYDGTAFHGSQVQGEINTVQLALNKAVSMLMREEIQTFGASRTDEGVHALCNYYHFDTEQELHPHFQYKMNAILPEAMSVSSVSAVNNPEANARFDAISRRYRYRIYHQKNPFKQNKALYFPYKLDKAVLDETAAIIKEHTDFTSFSKRNTQTYTFNCKIFDSYWEDYGEELHYVVEANRFLRGMVRGLVGTQLQAARGRMDVQGFKDVFAAMDCTKADFSVAGHGLYLENIKYPNELLTVIKDKR